MNLIAMSQIAVLRGRHNVAPESRRAESLRRAGYADGERMPRKQAHWANR